MINEQKLHLVRRRLTGGQIIVLPDESGKSSGSGGRSDEDFDEDFLVVATDAQASTHSGSVIAG